MDFKYILKQLLFPVNVTCAVCRKEEVYKYGLCKSCFDSLIPLRGDRCEICLDRINTEGLCSACLNKKPDYTRLYCNYSYAPPISNLVKDFKSSNKQYLKYSFAQIGVDCIEVLDKITLIVPVPASEKRLHERGYNQAQLIASELSKLTDIPLKEVLVRLKNTKTANLNKRERLDSIKDQFEFCQSVFDETVLLVDDVCTTGATLRECSKQLKKAGAKEVFCFTVARTEPRGF